MPPAHSHRSCLMHDDKENERCAPKGGASLSSRLLKACRKGNADLCGMLLKRNNGDVCPCDEWGNTCLHIATEEGHMDVVDVLCQHSGKQSARGHNHLHACETDIAARNDRGETALFIACSRGYQDIAIYLCKRMTTDDINSLDNFGCSALWIAASKGYHDVVQALYSMGGDLSQNNQYGETPLWIAAKNGHFDTVKCLCDLHCDVDVCNNLQESPVSAALDEDHLSVVDLLASYGATAWKNASLMTSSPSAERLLTHTMPCPPASLLTDDPKWRK
jgi:ankyrin repeat protein